MLAWCREQNAPLATFKKKYNFTHAKTNERKCVWLDEYSSDTFLNAHFTVCLVNGGVVFMSWGSVFFSFFVLYSVLFSFKVHAHILTTPLLWQC